MAVLEIFWVAIWVSLMVVLCLFGIQRLVILFLYWRSRHGRAAEAGRFNELPAVAVQLPIFNERHVAARLIRAVGRIDYPKDRLHIQVLDDSTDETTVLCKQEVAQLVSRGFDAVHLHRSERAGYKAGALEEATASTSADFLFVLDADFVPGEQILKQLVHHFTDPEVGMVQARWGHLNRRSSLITRLQAVFLDGHFLLEQVARNRSGCFFNFNGTAGMWRRRAIEDAGGWQHDTITEDLDLSYRAQLAGWRFIFLKDVVVAAELPADMSGFKSQQYRWTKGSAETCMKLLPRIWREAPGLGTRLMATAHLAANFSYLALLVLLAVGYPVAVIGNLGPLGFFLLDAPLFVFASGAVLLFYFVSQLVQPEGKWLPSLLLLPALFALGAGMALNNGRGVIEALLGRKSPFVRTPKSGDRAEQDEDLLASEVKATRRSYRVPRSRWVYLEGLFSLYFVASAVDALGRGHWGLAAFMAIFAAGFSMVSWAAPLLSLPFRARRAVKIPPEDSGGNRVDIVIEQVVTSSTGTGP